MKLKKKWWFLVVAVPIIVLCVNAGFWQLERGSQKQQLMLRLTEGSEIIVNASDYVSANVNQSTYRVNLPVVRRDNKIIYLDNRIQARIAGYDILVQYLLEKTDLAVWVNLGWVPAGSRRSVLPNVDVPSKFDLRGLLVKTPESFRMTEMQEEKFDSFIRVQALSSAIDRLVFAENGLKTSAISPMPRLGPENHYGYSIQWFLLAIILTGLTVYVVRREFT